MKKIISVSRRTDIPAFYGDWFMRRLDAGVAGWENPFGGQKYLVSLKPEDVLAFAFWSKNYRPFLTHLKMIKERGYLCLFNYTITGLPHEFECNLVPMEDAIDSFRALARMFSLDHMSWRYDPIVTSEKTDEAFHAVRFEELARQLQGYTLRCYFSFAIMYGKVERNFARFERRNRAGLRDPCTEERIRLAGRLADIASKYGITLYTCCGDYLISDHIRKAHCVDGDVVSRLYYQGTWKGIDRPTRKECGCVESTDIGRYDTCPHGCIYCYANVNKEQAQRAYQQHDPESSFLGYPRAQAEQIALEIRQKKRTTRQLPSTSQMQLGLDY